MSLSVQNANKKLLFENSPIQWRKIRPLILTKETGARLENAHWKGEKSMRFDSNKVAHYG